MASNKFRYPPAPPSGDQTFSPDIVGLQLVTGGGLTQGNFEFTTSIVEKVNRTFDVGVFSDPITLDSLDLNNVAQARAILAKQYRVYPNYDISVVTNFSLYGSLQKRLQVSVTKIINFFPAALEVNKVYYDYTTGDTATNISYDAIEDETTFDVNVARIKNPFDIDYSTNASRNLSVRPYHHSPLRNFTNEYLKYAVFVGTGETEYQITDVTPSNSLDSGTLQIVVKGNPFNGNTSTESLVIRPNNFYVEVAFDEPFDEVEKFLLNRLIRPKYTANFKFPRESENGQFYIASETVTWKLDGRWNLDIRTSNFDVYLNDLSVIAESIDNWKTNLISRFLITGAFKDFDTDDQRVEKVIQVYGRSYDETKKFIDALAYMTSVNYNPGNDIPSQLLQNLALTLGYNPNISPITNDNFLESVFGTKNDSIYPGYTRDMTPSELNYEFYTKIILNAGYLFRSKGTRKSIEAVLRMVGAPQALVEFNETVYIADGPVNMEVFDSQYAQLTGGTYSDIVPVLDPTNVYKIQGTQYTGTTTTANIYNINLNRLNYPVDKNGYPTAPINTVDMFFEKGSGWFEQTPKHRAPQQVDITASVFTGSNPNFQTTLEPYSYGQKYFDVFRKFPYMTIGFDLTRVYDNLKSWSVSSTGLRRSTGAYNAYYRVEDEKLVLNAKNVDLFLNVGQGLTYDVWTMSNRLNYPIPASGLTTGQGGIDNTVIQPNPKQKTFFEFAQTFYHNMINVRNRQTITDGKTGGYPTLQKVYWDYLQSQQAINIPSNQYTYQKMIDFTLGIGDYWIRFVEQMIPASTIWMGGMKMENSAFHRQKVVWRRQRGCEIVPVPCVPCSVTGQLFGYDCVDQYVECSISPSVAFSQVLYNQIVSCVESSGYTTSQCDLYSVTSDWYVDLRLDGGILIQEQFYTGYGASDYPTNNEWKTALNDKLVYLFDSGLDYTINGDMLKVSSLACDGGFEGSTLQLNVGINVTIHCG